MEFVQTFLQQAWLPLLLTALAAYLLGSFNFAIIVTKALSHGDIRETGSGNAGATNVLRSQGKLPALLTTLGDLAKSFAAVLLARLLIFPRSAAGNLRGSARISRGFSASSGICIRCISASAAAKA